jgi:hypothetical protein
MLFYRYYPLYDLNDPARAGPAIRFSHNGRFLCQGHHEKKDLFIVLCQKLLFEGQKAYSAGTPGIHHDVSFVSLCNVLFHLLFFCFARGNTGPAAGVQDWGVHACPLYPGGIVHISRSRIRCFRTEPAFLYQHGFVFFRSALINSCLLGLLQSCPKRFQVCRGFPNSPAGTGPDAGIFRGSSLAGRAGKVWKKTGG